MESFPIKLGNQPYTFGNFLKYLSVSNIGFTNCSIIGITLPLIKMQIKLFQNSQPIAWLASKLNKLSNKINFTFF